MTACAVFEAFEKANGAFNWCRENYLNRNVVREIADLRDYFRKSLRDGGWTGGRGGRGGGGGGGGGENLNGGCDAIVHAAVAAGLYGNIARWSRTEGVFFKKDKVALHGSSVLSEKDGSAWREGGTGERMVVFHELFRGAKATWCNMGAVVSPLVLLLFAAEGDAKVEYGQGTLKVEGWGGASVKCGARLAVSLDVVRGELKRRVDGFMERKGGGEGGGDGEGGGEDANKFGEEDDVMKLVLNLLRYN